jgi:transposase
MVCAVVFNSVLVLDNCNIHHAEKVRKLVEDEARAFHLMSIATIYLLTFPLECKLIFLPPYSPDLNPIEQAFSSIKSYLRRYWQDQTFSIMDHACQNINSEKAWAFFRASGYVA